MRLCLTFAFVIFLLSYGHIATTFADDKWPALPERNASVELPTQEWPLRPGPRQIRVLVHYPQGKLANVTAETGIMLSLHNWGGTDCAGTANPTTLAERLNVVAVCVNYLQSGPKDSIEGPEPYDFGYLQALDALRALYWMDASLKDQQITFANDRLFATGGSGGGNVTLMACKLAPHTFTAVVDMCGMKKLSDDIAFNIPGGSGLDARFRREPDHPYFLSRDHQELRWLGNPDHLALMVDYHSPTRIVSVHGAEDQTCPFPDALEFAANAKAAGLAIEPHFVKAEDLDGAVFTSTGHGLGNRTEIVFKVAGKWLDPTQPTALRRPSATDFDLRKEIHYPTSGGRFVISYQNGYPEGRFEAAAPPPVYSDHLHLDHFLDQTGQRRPIESVADWSVRKRHIQRHLQQVMGQLPGPLQRIPLDVKILDETRIGNITRRKLTYQSDPTDRVPAYVLIPDHQPGQKLPAVLCLQPTGTAGKDIPAGLAGPSSRHYGLRLAERGYVVIVPDYPSFGEHQYEFGPQTGYASGSMKAIWDNIRAVDLLETLPMVDSQRIGCIGHSLGGHNAIFTGVFDERLKAIVSNCGFCTFPKDDIPSWTGPRYMPRIATVYQNDASLIPFDFPELIAALAPRPFLASAAESDADFDVSGVHDCVQSARPIYEMFDAGGALEEFTYPGPHDFPQSAHDRANAFLDRQLK